MQLESMEPIGKYRNMLDKDDENFINIKQEHDENDFEDKVALEIIIKEGEYNNTGIEKEAKNNDNIKKETDNGDNIKKEVSNDDDIKEGSEYDYVKIKKEIIEDSKNPFDSSLHKNNTFGDSVSSNNQNHSLDGNDCLMEQDDLDNDSTFGMSCLQECNSLEKCNSGCNCNCSARGNSLSERVIDYPSCFDENINRFERKFQSQNNYQMKDSSDIDHSTLENDNDCSKVVKVENSDSNTGHKSNIFVHTGIHSSETYFQHSICDFKTARSKLKVHTRNHIFNEQGHASDLNIQFEKTLQCSENAHELIESTKNVVVAATDNDHKMVKNSVHEKMPCNHFEPSSSVEANPKLNETGRCTSEKPLQYGDCDNSPSKKSFLKRHIRTHTREKPFKCSECDYNTSKRKSLDVHMRSKHTFERPFKCSDCNYSASIHSHLQRHIRIHTGEKPFKCSECDYSASLKPTLIDHIRCKHTTDRPFKCDKCDYSASRKSNLVFHIRSKHTTDRPFKCTDCDFSAVKESHLVDHIRSQHTADRPFKCSECDYSASRKSSLDVHMRSRHAPERPFKCNECDYSAPTTSELKIHTRIHKGEKPFVCSECNYRASQKSNLKRHERRHTKERSFK